MLLHVFYVQEQYELGFSITSQNYVYSVNPL
jgi:hypothetical protein